MPKLLLKFNAAVIKEISLADRTGLSVGRKPDNDVVIDNPAVSSYHCKIVKKGDVFYVEDLESTNGTYVNEKRVIKAGLHHNDVVGVARHALVFIEEAEQASSASPQSEPPASEEPPAETGEPEPQSAETGSEEKDGRIGGLRVLKGVVDKNEYELKGLSTYIGKSDRVQVPIMGSGLFKSAPEVAASIHKKPEGYTLMAVKDGFPVLNGTAVSGSVALNDGDIIECGGTTLQFFLK